MQPNGIRPGVRYRAPGRTPDSYTDPTMNYMRKLSTPIVWLVVVALVLGIGAGFFSVLS